MSTTVTGQDARVPAIITQFRTDLSRMESQFKMALPAHIPVDRFVRVIMTAVQNTPKLLACDRQSFFNAAMKAASDGLLPDGREGAIVPFGDNDDDQGGRKRGDAAKATWMPMIAGLRKVARNSGEIDTWDVYLVHEGDDFAYELGDDPYIKHKPAAAGGLHRKITHAYSVAKLKDGGISRDVMNIEEIEDIRKAFSRASKGPWTNPVTYGEMAKKTVARRHSKMLPKSTDLDRVLHRDDELYDFARARQDAEHVNARRPANVAAALDHFASGPETAATAATGNGGKPPPQEDETQSQASTAAPDQHAAPENENGNAETKPNGPPTDTEGYKQFARKIIDDMSANNETAKLESWFASDAQRSMRNSCGVMQADFVVVQSWVREALDKHKASRK